MKQANRTPRRLALALAAAAVFATSASGAITITFAEVDGNVTATYSGTVILDELIPIGGGSGSSFVNPGMGTVGLGPVVTNYFHVGVAGPGNFGNGGFTAATTGSGDSFGFVGSTGLLYLPEGYVSGTEISGTALWEGATLSSLGMTPGTYSWTLPNDTITLNVVPEPSSALLLGFAALALTAQRRR